MTLTQVTAATRIASITDTESFPISRNPTGTKMYVVMFLQDPGYTLQLNGTRSLQFKVYGSNDDGSPLLRVYTLLSNVGNTELYLDQTGNFVGDPGGTSPGGGGIIQTIPILATASTSYGFRIGVKASTGFSYGGIWYATYVCDTAE